MPTFYRHEGLPDLFSVCLSGTILLILLILLILTILIQTTKKTRGTGHRATMTRSGSGDPELQLHVAWRGTGPRPTMKEGRRGEGQALALRLTRGSP